MPKVTSSKVTSILIGFIGLTGAIDANCNQAIAVSHIVNGASQNYQITVNSNADGEIQSDRELTLREALEISNGSLKLDRLSDAERAQVKPSIKSQGSQISFNLPSDRTTIRLRKALPTISSQNLVIDGTTQSGYDSCTHQARNSCRPAAAAALRQTYHRGYPSQPS